MRSGHAFAAIAVAATMISAPLSAQSLTPWDVFVYQNFALQNTEVNGKVAIGGNATFNYWRVGHRLTPGTSEYSLFVGNNLTAFEGSVAEGRTYVGGTYSGTNVGFPAAYPPEVGGPAPFDFMAEMLRLTNISNNYAATSANGSVQLINGNELAFIGNQQYNIFEISIAQLQQGTGGYQFVAPTGSTNVVNVTGMSTSSAFANAPFYFGCTEAGNEASCQTGTNENTPSGASYALWNFNQQVDLILGGPVHGSIMAPNAAVQFGIGDVVGTVIVKSGYANSEFYSARDFEGYAPETVTPEPATLGLKAIGLVGIGLVRRRRKA